MEALPADFEVIGIPPHVKMWSVARIPNFIPSVIARWQRSHGTLPPQFYAVMCPRVEVNAAGGLSPRVIELTDPRLRCHHFTGCHRPYLVVFFVGEDADQRRADVQALLAWSESYRVDLTEDALRLTFIDATEEVADHGTKAASPRRTLRDLLETGEIVGILE